MAAFIGKPAPITLCALCDLLFTNLVFCEQKGAKDAKNGGENYRVICDVRIAAVTGRQ